LATHTFIGCRSNLPEKKPFHEKDYIERDNGRYYPILNIKCFCKDSKGISITLTGDCFSALADTGCDTGIALSKDMVQGIDLGEKKTDVPIEIGVADGHIIAADVYEVTIQINGEKRTAELSVIDTEKILRLESGDLFPCIGRNFLDNFDVMFKGSEKKLVLLK